MPGKQLKSGGEMMKTLIEIGIGCAILACLLTIILCVRVGPFLKVLADKNARLLGALIELEWSHHGACPFCGADSKYKHFDGCRYLTTIFKRGNYCGKKKTF
jgi:hypothetical protein